MISLRKAARIAKKTKVFLRGALGGLARVLQLVGSLPIQRLHYLLKALHPGFQVFDDLFCQDVWIW